MPLDKYPIISLTNKKTVIKNMFTPNVQTNDIFKNTDLLKVSETVNFGLAPQELLVLLNSYEMANLVKNDVTDEEFNAIETKLRIAIIEGYQYCKRKLGLKDKVSLIEYKNKKIIFNFINI